MRPIKITMQYEDGEFIATRLTVDEISLAKALIEFAWISSRRCVQYAYGYSRDILSGGNPLR